MNHSVHVCTPDEMEREKRLLKQGPGRATMVESKAVPGGYSYSVWHHMNDRGEVIAYTMVVIKPKGN